MLTLPSRIDAIDGATAAVEQAARKLGFAEDALFETIIAVREAIANAILHGNRQDEALPVEVGIVGTDNELIVTVRDYGTGFELSNLADPTAAENILKPSGRGLLLMRAVMDEIAGEQAIGGGTLVRMTRKR